MRQAQFLQFDLPCTDPERRDDWFIAERAPLAPEEEADIRAQYDTTKEADRAVTDRVTELKSRRRKAIQSCRFDCPMTARLLCLDEGLKDKMPGFDSGIWGGYTESERRGIVDSMAARKRGMATNQAAHVIITAEKKRDALQLN